MKKLIQEKLAKKQILQDRISIPFRLVFFNEQKIVKKNILTFKELEEIVAIADSQFTNFRGYNYQKEGFDILIDGYEVTFSFNQYGILRYTYDKTKSEISRLDYEITHYQKAIKESDSEDEME